MDEAQRRQKEAEEANEVGTATDEPGGDDDGEVLEEYEETSYSDDRLPDDDTVCAHVHGHAWPHSLLTGFASHLNHRRMDAGCGGSRRRCI